MAGRPGELARSHGWVAGITFALMVLSIYAIFIFSPMEKVMREVQKIFYVHVPIAWNAFLAFFVVFVASIAFLRTRKRSWDVLALASAEVGVIFTTLVWITGPIWARSAWNTWWSWEPRLTTALILWFIYIAYLLIRAAVDDPERRSRLAAVFGIVGFVDVPIVYFSVYWWRLSHPIVFGSRGGGLDPRMLVTLIISVFAFTGLYIYLVQKRISLENTRLEIQEVKSLLREEHD